MVVEDGNYVEVHYTGTLDDGTVFDSSEGKDALKVVLGKGLLIKGFEAGLIGMEEGQEKDINIPSAEAYGERKDGLVQVVEKQHLQGIDPQVGMQIGIKAPTGQVFPATITKVEGENVTLDANHPLAGQNLNFKLKVVTARAATDADLAEIQKAMQPPQQEGGEAAAPAEEPAQEASSEPAAEETPAETKAEESSEAPAEEPSSEKKE